MKLLLTIFSQLTMKSFLLICVIIFPYNFLPYDSCQVKLFLLFSLISYRMGIPCSFLPSISLPLSISLYLSIYLSLSLFPSLPLSIFSSPSFSLFVSSNPVSLPLYLSIYLSIYLSLSSNCFSMFSFSFFLFAFLFQSWSTF